MTYDSSLRAGGLQQAAAEAADDGASEAGSSAPKGGGKRATLCVSSQVGPAAICSALLCCAVLCYRLLFHDKQNGEVDGSTSTQCFC